MPQNKNEILKDIAVKLGGTPGKNDNDTNELLSVIKDAIPESGSSSGGQLYSHDICLHLTATGTRKFGSGGDFYLKYRVYNYSKDRLIGYYDGMENNYNYTQWGYRGPAIQCSISSTDDNDHENFPGVMTSGKFGYANIYYVYSDGTIDFMHEVCQKWKDVSEDIYPATSLY